MDRLWKTPYSKMADGRIVNRIESYQQRRIVQVPQNLLQKATIRVPQNDVVRMADGRLVSELETILRAIGTGGGGGGVAGVSDINGEIGAIVLALENTANDTLEFRVNNNAVNTINYMTDAEAQVILDGLI